MLRRWYVYFSIFYNPTWYQPHNHIYISVKMTSLHIIPEDTMTIYDNNIEHVITYDWEYIMLLKWHGRHIWHSMVVSFNHPPEHLCCDLTQLTHLTFGHSFNHHLGSSLVNLPDLTHLKFSYSCNQSLEGSLNNLPKLTHLTLGGSFNRKEKDRVNTF